MNFDWDDLRVFLAVARDGTLSAAAKTLRVSQPTVGRRLQNLEENLSARLFDRLPSGLATTAAGAELLPLAEDMERTADAVSRRQATFADQVSGTVRISSYELVAQYLTSRLPKLRQRLPEVELEFSVAHIAANLSRREADLLIRECMPDTPGLISRKLGGFAYAIYGSTDYVKDNPQALDDERYLVCDWVGTDDDHMYFPGQRWLRSQLGQRLPAVRSNNGFVLHESVRTGIGLGVLPCFVGDVDPALTRVMPPIDRFFSPLYLLVHDDLRRTPAVRAVMDTLIDVFNDDTAVLCGQVN